MSGKKRKAPTGNVVWRQSAEEATLAGNPRYNGFACGHGAHGDAKYNRAKAKRAWKAQMRQEGASRGSFLFARGPLMVTFGRVLELGRPNTRNESGRQSRGALKRVHERGAVGYAHKHGWAIRRITRIGSLGKVRYRDNQLAAHKDPAFHCTFNG